MATHNGWSWVCRLFVFALLPLTTCGCSLVDSRHSQESTAGAYQGPVTTEELDVWREALNCRIRELQDVMKQHTALQLRERMARGEDGDPEPTVLPAEMREPLHLTYEAILRETARLQAESEQLRRSMGGRL